MVQVQPVRIPGRWRDGRALDIHTVSSVYVGDDELGDAQFDTKRSDMGELLYRLKYRADRLVVSVEEARGWPTREAHAQAPRTSIPKDRAARARSRSCVAMTSGWRMRSRHTRAVARCSASRVPSGVGRGSDAR